MFHQQNSRNRTAVRVLHRGRRGRGVVLASVLLGITASGCGSSPSSATHDYWESLRAINAKADATFAKLERSQPTQPGQVRDTLRAMATEMQSASDAISGLPVSQVDSEAVSYGADLVLLARDTSALSLEMAEWIDQTIALGNYANSAEAGAEAFIRGFFGDPLGKAAELHSAASRLDSEGRRLLARWAALERRGNELEAREIRLRSALAERHGGEFLPLSTSENTPSDSATASSNEPKGANDDDPPEHFLLWLAWHAGKLTGGKVGKAEIAGLILIIIIWTMLSERRGTNASKSNKGDSPKPDRPSDQRACARCGSPEWPHVLRKRGGVCRSCAPFV